MPYQTQTTQPGAAYAHLATVPGKSAGSGLADAAIDLASDGLTSPGQLIFVSPVIKT